MHDAVILMIITDNHHELYFTCVHNSPQKKSLFNITTYLFSHNKKSQLKFDLTPMSAAKYRIGTFLLVISLDNSWVCSTRAPPPSDNSFRFVLIFFKVYVSIM